MALPINFFQSHICMFWSNFFDDSLILLGLFTRLFAIPFILEHSWKSIGAKLSYRLIRSAKEVLLLTFIGGTLIYNMTIFQAPNCLCYLFDFVCPFSGNQCFGFGNFEQIFRSIFLVLLGEVPLKFWNLFQTFLN